MKIFYLLIIFVLTTGFFHNKEKMLMKCADIKFEKLQKTYDKHDSLTLELLYKDSLEKRLSFWSGYADLYRRCELEFKSTPTTFKKLYK